MLRAGESEDSECDEAGVSGDTAGVSQVDCDSVKDATVIGEEEVDSEAEVDVLPL